MLLKRLSNACQIQVMGFCASHARAIDDLVFKLTYYQTLFTPAEFENRRRFVCDMKNKKVIVFLIDMH